MINELRGARAKYGYTKEEMGRRLGIAKQTYHMKENGVRTFTDEEKLKLIKELDLSFDQFNAIFFKGALPWTMR